MYLSLNWLGEFVDLSGRTPEQVAEDLTMRTALVEGLLRRGDLPGTFVVGTVRERRPHPRSERLSVCTVDLGASAAEIVCGAANVAAGQRVVVAKPGSVLPDGRRIEPTAIRGVDSHGMICSAAELGVGDDAGGILVLADDAPPGTPFRELPGAADVLLDIDNKSITHRPDLWGHLGFARELAAIYRRDLREPATATDLSAGAGPVQVDITATDLCGRYCALFARGRLGGPAPSWVQRRLEYCGLRPRSLAVDLSNYVMLELGQPSHPFDRRSLRGDRIEVRRARAGERLRMLDGEERELPEGGCVIADAERVVAVAGIMGGESSGVQPDTVEIVLESAWFDPIAVRRTGSALALRTDALARFEKDIDPELAEAGIRRYAALLRQVAPDVEVAGQFVSTGARRGHSLAVSLRPERVRAKLGSDVDDREMVALLERLRFECRAGDGALHVRVPSFRAARDISTEDDLIEEVGRIHGYDRIPAELPRFECRPVRLEPLNQCWRTVVNTLSGRMGFAEVLSYPYADGTVLERTGGAGTGPWVRLRNPLQSTAARLRRSLVPALLEFVDRNIKAYEEVRLYECGHVFLPGGNPAELPYEPLFAGAVLAERSTRKNASGRVLRELKGSLEELGHALRRPLRFAAARGVEPPAWAHPARLAAVLVGEDAIGWLGQVHPRVAEGYAWLGEVAVFECDLARVAASPEAAAPYRPPARFPAVRQDVSFVAAFDLTYDAIRDGLESEARFLTGLELVDEYTSAPAIQHGHRSLTLRLSFQSEERTLTDQEVGAEMEKVRAWLLGKGATLRGE